MEADYSTGEQFAYGYDEVGNMVVITETITSTVATTYTYNAANQLKTAHASEDGVTWYYTYDQRGNLVRQTPGGTEPAAGETRYTYNGANQLLRVELYTAGAYTTLAAAAYNADGERVRLTTYAAGVPLTVTYGVFQEELLVGDDNTQTTHYLHGRSFIAEHGDEWAYHLRDGEGSVRQETDDAGAVTAAREWTPFGVELALSGVEETNKSQTGLGYTGEWWDADVGLEYLRARWYQPGTGRFTRRDPLEGILQRPDTQHRYAYAAANPVNFSDPRGLWYGPDIYDPSGAETCEEQDAFWREYCRVFPKDCGTYGTPVPIPVKVAQQAFYWPVSAQGQPDQLRDKCYKNRILSTQGRDLMHRWEGWRNHMYDDSAGHCTVGWGHLIHLNPCVSSCRLCQTPEECTQDSVQCTSEEEPFCGGITEEEGKTLYINDTQIAVNQVNGQVHIPLTQEQFDALVSFTFNRGQLGAGNTNNTDVLSLVNQYRFEEAAQAFNEYIYAWGSNQPQPGLVNRRGEESQLFSDGNYNYSKWCALSH